MTGVTEFAAEPPNELEPRFAKAHGATLIRCEMTLRPSTSGSTSRAPGEMNYETPKCAPVTTSDRGVTMPAGRRRRVTARTQAPA